MEQFINEVWRPVEVNPVYLVSNYGRVKTIDHPVWCKVNNSYSIRKGRMCVLSNKNTKKYWRVCIQINNKQKMFAVHRLVATAFIPNPNNLLQVNHKDGNKNNNCISNLEWCDNLYNMRHAIANNLSQSLKHRKRASLKCNFRKLTPEQVAFIKTEYAKLDTSIKGNEKYFFIEIAQQFNLQSTNTVHWIVKGTGKKGQTNKFINQDIVQTTNYQEMLNEHIRIHQEIEKTRPVLLKDIAISLGVNVKTFNDYYLKHGKNLDETIAYYKQHDKQRKL